MMDEQNTYNHVWQAIREVSHRANSIVFDEQLLDAPLTGRPLYLTANEMMYLFLILQNRFGVRFQEADVIDYAFNTLRKVAEAVERRTLDGHPA